MMYESPFKYHSFYINNIEKTISICFLNHVLPSVYIQLETSDFYRLWVKLEYTHINFHFFKLK